VIAPVRRNGFSRQNAQAITMNQAVGCGTSIPHIGLAARFILDALTNPLQFFLKTTAVLSPNNCSLFQNNCSSLLN
jgi:hypothetical protein